MVSFPATPSSSIRDNEKDIQDILPVTVSRTTVKFHMCSAIGGCDEAGVGEAEAEDGGGCGMFCGLLLSLSASTGRLRRPGTIMFGIGGLGATRARAMLAKSRMVGREECIVAGVAVVLRGGSIRGVKEKNYHEEDRYGGANKEMESTYSRFMLLLLETLREKIARPRSEGTPVRTGTEPRRPYGTLSFENRMHIAQQMRLLGVTCAWQRCRGDCRVCCVGEHLKAIQARRRDGFTRRRLWIPGREHG